MQAGGGYSRTWNSIRNSTVAVLLQFISLLVGFFSRKIFLDYLGTEVLGLEFNDGDQRRGHLALSLALSLSVLLAEGKLAARKAEGHGQQRDGGKKMPHSVFCSACVLGRRWARNC